MCNHANIDILRGWEERQLDVYLQYATREKEKGIDSRKEEDKYAYNR